MKLDLASIIDSTIRDYADSYEESVKRHVWFTRHFAVEKFCEENPRYAARARECERRIRAENQPGRLSKCQPVLLEEMERRERECQEWMNDDRERCCCSCHDED